MLSAMLLMFLLAQGLALMAGTASQEGTAWNASCMPPPI